MDFKQFEIKISYKSVGESAFCEIINPLLSCTKSYKRSVGFFSSSSLTFIGNGILDMARNGGTVFLATSPKLSAEDIDAIHYGYEAREIIEKRFIFEVEQAIREMDDSNVELLYNLVKEKIIEVKIIRKKNGMYHDKLAILEDFSENTIVFVGSNNESYNGYHENYEKIRVYKSWIDSERVSDEIEEFESIWDDDNDELIIYEFNEAFEKKLLERIEHKGPFTQKKEKYDIRPYQATAKANWIDKGHNGFFVMATGTGKTITSLNAIKEFIYENRLLTVIAVPYKHLVNQWYEDVKSFFNDAYIHLVHGEIKYAEERIYASYCLAKNKYKPLIVITTIKSFFLNRYASLYDKISFEKLLIVDEAHNFINQISDELSLKYPFKLGLSATPVFGKDKEKSERLLNWFGGIAMNFPIEKAIGKYLVNYEYHPIFVNATQKDEEKFSKATSLMLSGIDPVKNIIIDEEKFTLGYRGRLRAISMAEEKITRIDEIYSYVKDKDHTIIYCSDGKLFYDNSNDGIQEIRHLEYMLSLINRSILNNSKDVKASKFTATEDVATRMRLINAFNKGLINYLVAIRCLDEGINIPSIKSALILSSNDNYREFVQRRGRILRLYDDGTCKKELAHIYDVIVLPSDDNSSFAEIELRRYLEYSKLAVNHTSLENDLHLLLDRYNLTLDDISFDNEFLNGGDLDE